VETFFKKKETKHQTPLVFRSLRNTTDLCLDSNPLHTFPGNFFALLRQLQKAIVAEVGEAQEQA